MSGRDVMRDEWQLYFDRASSYQRVMVLDTESRADTKKVFIGAYKPYVFAVSESVEVRIA